MVDHRYLQDQQQTENGCLSVDHGQNLSQQVNEAKMVYQSFENFKVQSPTSEQRLSSPELTQHTPNFIRKRDQSSEVKKQFVQQPNPSYFPVKDNQIHLINGRTRN